jgi:hypothetical protein
VFDRRQNRKNCSFVQINKKANMIDKFSMLAKKYSVPVIFTLVSIITLVIAVKNEQGMHFFLAAGLMCAASILSILFSMGKLKSRLAMGVGGATGIIALFTIFLFYKGCQDTVIHNENYNDSKRLTIQNLQDIRDIQKIFHEQNGRYLKSWEELESFALNGTVEYVETDGSVPSRKITVEERDFLYGDNRPLDYDMTETEAWRLSQWKQGPNYQADFKRFKRDTVQKSLLELRFTENRAYKEGRDKAGFPQFDVKKLRYVPLTSDKEQWLIETIDSVMIGETSVAVLKVSGFLPVNEFEESTDREEIWFGNLQTQNLAGSWEK